MRYYQGEYDRPRPSLRRVPVSAMSCCDGNFKLFTRSHRIWLVLDNKGIYYCPQAQLCYMLPGTPHPQYSSSADLRSCVLILLMLFFLSGGTLTASTTADIPFRGSYRLPLLSNFSASGICRRMYSSALRLGHWSTSAKLLREKRAEHFCCRNGDVCLVN